MTRFRGGGVGHNSTREATDFFKQDRDSRDAIRVFEEDIEDYDQTQYESTVPNRSRADRDDEEEDYGYNRGQFSDTDEEEAEEVVEVCSDDDFGPEDDGGMVDEFVDNLGYGDTLTTAYTVQCTTNKHLQARGALGATVM